MNMLDTDFQGSCISSTMMHGTTNAYYYEHYEYDYKQIIFYIYDNLKL